MDDAGVRRHHAEVLESRLSPTQERVAFLVAFEFDDVIEIKGIRGAVVIDLHGMVDDQFSRCLRIDAGRGATEFDNSVAHRGEIDDGRYAGEILQDDTTRGERNFGARGCMRIPVRERQDVVACDIAPVFMAQQIFQQDLEGEG